MEAALYDNGERDYAGDQAHFTQKSVNINQCFLTKQAIKNTVIYGQIH
jgi:hypothetical protein